VVPSVTLILLSAGSSSRFEKQVKKQWLRIGDTPLWQAVVDRLSDTFLFSSTVITAHSDDIAYMKRFGEYNVVLGGEDRQASIANALVHVKSDYVLITDVARACISDLLITKLLDPIRNDTTIDAVVPYLHVNDTVLLGEDQIDRSLVKRIQTPQLSRTSLLKSHINDTIRYTDESTLMRANGANVLYIEGGVDAEKITFEADLKKIIVFKGTSIASICRKWF
jgi:2-C-methyl-D-erythritol 4-phosphate cytidylyltransferase/2-C-methyl-D-erythritol 2,4-cyclodiphosphate synthase